MRDLKKLALLLRAVHERREQSWVPGIGRSQGRYGITENQAIDEACEALGAGDEFKTPISLMRMYTSDGLDWAAEMLADEPNDQAGADITALAAAAEQSSQ